jgi:hypothetical protein
VWRRSTHAVPGEPYRRTSSRDSSNPKLHSSRTIVPSNDLCVITRVSHRGSNRSVLIRARNYRAIQAEIRLEYRKQKQPVGSEFQTTPLPHIESKSWPTMQLLFFTTQPRKDRHPQRNLLRRLIYPSNLPLHLRNLPQSRENRSRP